MNNQRRENIIRGIDRKPYKATASINGYGEVPGVVDAEKPARNGGKLVRFKAKGMRARWVSDQVIVPQSIKEIGQ